MAKEVEKEWFDIWDSKVEVKIKEILRKIADTPSMTADCVLDEIAKIYALVQESEKGTKAKLGNLAKLIKEYSAKNDESMLMLISQMAKLVLKLDEYFPDKKIPYVKSDTPYNLTHKVIASIVAGGFFGIYPDQNDCNLPSMHDFYFFFEFDDDIFLEKLKFYFQYFKIVTKEEPKGSIVILRSIVPKKFNVGESLKKSKAVLTEVKALEDGKMEDVPDADVVNFANMCLGGGCMRGAAVQEEILFLIFPELFAVRTISRIMKDNESIVIKGLQRYSSYKGYSFDCKYDGPYTDKLAESLKVDTDRIDRVIISMDALYIHMLKVIEQIEPTSVDREIIKAIAGFKTGTKTISTGRWGCGAFNGCSQLKFLIQWIAASYCKRKMVFSKKEDETLKDMEEIIAKYTGQPAILLYETILVEGKKYCKSKVNGMPLEADDFDEFAFKMLKEKQL